jgi:uncharacterized protein (TIGR01777 family)
MAAAQQEKKVVVTGGTGFLGSALLPLLAQAGYRATVLSRSPPKSKASLPPGTEWARFDALSGDMDASAFTGAQAVVHFAGESLSDRWTDDKKQKVMQSRQRGTAAVVQAAAKSGTVKALVSTSAIGIYGPRGDEPLDENASLGSDFLAQVCRVWEDEAQKAEGAGIRVARVRVGLVLHPSGGALGRMLLPFKMGAGGRLGSGQQYMSWIHRDDVLRLFVHALEREDISGPLNGTAPNPVTNREFTRALGVALHRPTVLPAPAFMLKLAFGEMSSILLTGQKVLPARALATGFQFHFPTLDAALGDLFGKKAA